VHASLKPQRGSQSFRPRAGRDRQSDPDDRGRAELGSAVDAVGQNCCRHSSPSGAWRSRTGRTSVRS